MHFLVIIKAWLYELFTESSVTLKIKWNIEISSANFFILLRLIASMVVCYSKLIPIMWSNLIQNSEKNIYSQVDKWMTFTELNMHWGHVATITACCCLKHSSCYCRLLHILFLRHSRCCSVHHIPFSTYLKSLSLYDCMWCHHLLFSVYFK